MLEEHNTALLEGQQAWSSALRCHPGEQAAATVMRHPCRTEAAEVMRIRIPLCLPSLPPHFCSQVPLSGLKLGSFEKKWDFWSKLRLSANFHSQSWETCNLKGCCFTGDSGKRKASPRNPHTDLGAGYLHPTSLDTAQRHLSICPLVPEWEDKVGAHYSHSRDYK